MRWRSCCAALVLCVAVVTEASAQVPEQARMYREAAGLAAWAALQPNYRAFQQYYADAAVYHDCLATNLITGVQSRDCNEPVYPTDQQALASGCSTTGVPVDPNIQPVAPPRLPAPGPCGAPSGAGYAVAGPETNFEAVARALGQHPELMDSDEGAAAAGAMLGVAALADLLGGADAAEDAAPAVDYDALERRALAYEESRQWSAAEELWRQLTAARPGDPIPLAHLGFVVIWQGRDAEAEPYLREAISIDPEYRWARETLAWSLDHTGRAAEAEEQRDEIEGQRRFQRLLWITGGVTLVVMSIVFATSS